MISKKLFTAGINSDDADVLVDPKGYINALNIRFATSESGKVGQLSNIEGNTLKATTINNVGVQIEWALPTGINTTIGAIEDTPNKRIFFFNKNSNGSDGIYCYDAGVSLIYTVLLASQVDGGLSLSSNIHSVAIIDKLLYWTDGIRPQRRINVDAGIKLNHPSYSTTVTPYVSTIKQSVISLIRNQPWAPLSAVKSVDTAYINNFIYNEAFQFAYRFIYRDFEVSTFSPLSGMLNYNDQGSSLNRIIVTVPLNQKIEQDVLKIEIAVKYVVGGKYSIVKTFTSGFTEHNSGTALSFSFYNDAVGIAVDDVSAFKQYDTIPLKSQTLEIAKNRLFLGNNYDGYETPLSTSLGLSTTIGGGSTLTGQWCRLIYRSGGSEVTLYLFDVTGISPNAGYYQPSTPPTPPTFPTTVAWSTLTYRGAGVQDVLTYLGVTFLDFVSFTAGLGTANVTGYPGTINSLVGARAFKSDSLYRLGVVFFDEAGRKCGVVTSESLKQNTSDRTYNTPSFTTDINWTLTNSATPSITQAEIPQWAYYYSVVMTKNLRTNFFIQSRTPDITYVKKDAAGEYVVDGAYSEKHFGVAISLSSLYGYGQGYSFQEGDICKIYSPTDKYITKVKDTFAEYVIVDLRNFGPLTSTTDVYLFEIYSPYTQSTNEVYYERSQVYPINNSGLANRSYSTISGSFKGDITLLERSLSTSTYLVESMSPSDINWKNWNTDAGRPNIVLDVKPSNKKTSIYFSNVIVLGSQTNGLSTFDVLDQTQLPYELSSIQKLELVSKVESEGTVMIAVGEQETASIYLGESQVFDNAGSSFLAKSSGVIGNVNVMRGSYGTINPESIVSYMGNVYWFDANKGSVVSYSVNGLFPISSNKMQKYFRKVGQDVISKGLKFYGGIDPYHNEVLMFAPRKSVVAEGARINDMVLSSNTYSFTTTDIAPATINITVTEGKEYIVTAPAGITVQYNGETITNTFIANGITQIVLTSATTIVGNITVSEILRSYYETYDAQGGVWVFSPGLDKWISQYSFRPEWMTLVGNRLVTFKNGKPYVHDSTTMNTFYGQAYDSVVALSHNEAGNIIKSYTTVSFEGSKPSLVHIRTEVPNVQSSDIRLSEFVVTEGVNYAPIFRDRLSPNDTGSFDEKIYIGDRMRGEIGKFQINYTQPTTEKILKFFNVGFLVSRGHNTTPENGG